VIVLETTPRVYGIAGGALSVKFPLDGYFPDDPMQVIPGRDRSSLGSQGAGLLSTSRSDQGRIESRALVMSVSDPLFRDMCPLRVALNVPSKTT
jgi:hypothetical protein